MFGGWGSGPELFREYAVPDGYDFMLCYDYRDMEFDFSMLEGYSDVRLVAWSMGVWAAGQVLGNHDMRWGRRVAINGTTFPVNDTMGIPVDIFKGTLDGMSPVTLAKFRRRMCGSSLEHFMAHMPDRNADELKEELACILYNVDSSSVDCRFGWDMAVICGADKIFPAQNQRNAWESLGVETMFVETAWHYEPSVFKAALEENWTCWTRN